MILDYAYPKPKIQHLIYIMRSTSIYVPFMAGERILNFGFLHNLWINIDLSVMELDEHAKSFCIPTMLIVFYSSEFFDF